jgi:hypothetical protein
MQLLLSNCTNAQPSVCALMPSTQRSCMLLLIITVVSHPVLAAGLTKHQDVQISFQCLKHLSESSWAECLLSHAALRLTPMGTHVVHTPPPQPQTRLSHVPPTTQNTHILTNIPLTPTTLSTQYIPHSCTPNKTHSIPPTFLHPSLGITSTQTHTPSPQTPCAHPKHPLYSQPRTATHQNLGFPLR